MTTPTGRLATGEPEIPRFAEAGVQIAGRYRLARRIAGGGMGEVWRAHDRILDAPVAIKLLRAEYLEEPLFLERLRAEARLAGMLDHRGIAAIMDYGEQDGPAGSAWLVMELVEGEPLSKLLARMGKLPAAQVLHIVGQAAVALQAAHDAGVVHRDVKPGNVLVQPDGVVKLTDFGIARAMGSIPLTRTGTVLGTAHYLSPEQACGEPASPASDVYALGVVAYECLTGRRPFEGESPVQVALAHQRGDFPPLPEDLPAPVVGLVMRALAKTPAERAPSAGRFGRTALGIRAALYLDDPSGDPPAHPIPPAAATSEEPNAGTGPTNPPGGSPRRPMSVRRRKRLVRLAQLLGAAAAVAIAIMVVVEAGSSPGSGTTATTPPSVVAPPPGISVDPATYRGRSADIVISELTSLGLTPRRSDVVATGLPDTVVTIVGNDGGPLPARLARGAAVVVQVVASTSSPTSNDLASDRNEASRSR